MKGLIKSSLEKVFSFVSTRELKNIRNGLQRRALEETLDFIEQNLANVPSFRNKFKLLEAALSEVNGQPGMFCEFGVYRGETINFIASRTSQKIYGFDSFEGLPEDWQYQCRKGEFKLNGLPRVKSNVALVVGLFSDTLPGFTKEHAGPCAFLHIDCDLYSSTKTVFEHLGDRIQPGTVIVFDEFFNYPGWKNGEYRAFCEFMADRDLRFRYIGYAERDEQVALIVQPSSSQSDTP